MFGQFWFKVHINLACVKIPTRLPDMQGRVLQANLPYGNNILDGKGTEAGTIEESGVGKLHAWMDLCVGCRVYRVCNLQVRGNQAGHNILIRHDYCISCYRQNTFYTIWKEPMSENRIRTE